MLALNLTKSSKAMMYDLLTHIAGRTIAETDVTVSAPAVIADAQAGQPNTTVTLTYVDGSQAIQPGGATTLSRKLTRIDLAAVATIKNFTGVLADDISKYTDVAYVVGKVNAGLGTVLAQEEVTLENVTTVDGVTDLDVQIKPTAHYGLFGKVHLKVTDNVDHRPTLATAFAAENLDGYSAPAAV